MLLMAVLVTFFGVFPPITVTDGHTTDDPPWVKKKPPSDQPVRYVCFFQSKKMEIPPPPGAVHHIVLIGTLFLALKRYKIKHVLLFFTETSFYDLEEKTCPPTDRLPSAVKALEHAA